MGCLEITFQVEHHQNLSGVGAARYTAVSELGRLQAWRIFLSKNEISYADALVGIQKTRLNTVSEPRAMASVSDI